ncbi:hypothetical protein P7C70_g831, partial [Phenoliferia sp. Uapishka_3]
MISRYSSLSLSTRQLDSSLSLPSISLPILPHLRTTPTSRLPQSSSYHSDLVRTRHQHLTDSLASARGTASTSRPFSSAARPRVAQLSSSASVGGVRAASTAAQRDNDTLSAEEQEELELESGKSWKGKGKETDRDLSWEDSKELAGRRSQILSQQLPSSHVSHQAGRHPRAVDRQQAPSPPNPPTDPPPLNDLSSRQPPSPPPPLSSSPNLRGFIIRRLNSLPKTNSLDDLRTIHEEIIGAHLLTDVAIANSLVYAALSRNLSSAARQFLKSILRAMKAVKRPPASLVAAIEAPMRTLAKGNRWALVKAFSDIAITDRVLSLDILRLRMRSLYEAGRYADVVRTFALFAEAGLEPDERVLDELVCAHLRNGDLDLAHAVLEEKSLKGFKTTERTVLAILDGMRGLGGNEAMEANVLSTFTRGQISNKTALRQNVRVLNRIMSIRADREALQHALRILEYFNLDALPRPLPVEVISIRSSSHPFQLQVPYASQPPPKSPPSAHWRPMPDAATFSILMSIALRRKFPTVAFQLFIESQALNLGMSESLVAQLARAVLVHAGVVEAEQFVFKLSSGTATLPEIEGFFVPMFEPTALVYETLLTNVLFTSGLRGASALFGRMEETTKGKIEVSEGVVAGLVKYLSSKENGESLRHSTDFLARMNVLTSGATKPTISNLNDLIKSVWQRERFQNRSRFARKRGGQLSAPGAMTRVRSSLEDREVADDSTTIQQLLRNGAIESPSAMWDYLYTQIVDRGSKPTRHHITVIMRAHIKLGDLDGARATFRRALELGVERHVSFYSVLIGGAARLGGRQEVTAIEREMKLEGIAPDRNLYAALAFAASKRRSVRALDGIIREARTVVPNIDVDPTFVLLKYRALVETGKLLEAQLLMRKRLAMGLQPDRGVSVVLRRSARYLNRKANGPKALTKRQVVTRKYLRRNVNVVRRLDNRETLLGGMKDLEKLEGFLNLLKKTAKTKKKGRRRGGQKKKKDVGTDILAE